MEHGDVVCSMFLHIKYDVLGTRPGIEPSSPACQVGVLTTTLQHFTSRPYATVY